jgi:uncharacterized Fe-S cluster-containing MiaB family protein
MKVELLRLGAANKPSSISEGVMEIRINSQSCKGINLTTWHTQARRAPWVATIHDVAKETTGAHPTLVDVLHAYASVDTPWVANALSRCTPVRYDMICCVSVTHDTTQFGDSICLVCISTFQMLLHSDPTDVGLNRHRRGLPPPSSEFQIRPLILVLIQYFPLSPNCPAQSHI